ncbi:MAG: hypothetical protein COA79_25825, partial [Planctomycetota bacterium]
ILILNLIFVFAVAQNNGKRKRPPKKIKKRHQRIKNFYLSLLLLLQFLKINKERVLGEGNMEVGNKMGTNR